MAGAAVLEKDERPALSWQHHLGDKGHSWLHALLFLSSCVWDGDAAMPIQPPEHKDRAVSAPFPAPAAAPCPGKRQVPRMARSWGVFRKKGMLGVSLLQIPA